jgi:hypothetical protein
MPILHQNTDRGSLMPLDWSVQTDETIAAAIQGTRAERIANGLDPDTGRALQLPVTASVRPNVVPFRSTTEALVRVDTMQWRETHLASQLAAHLVDLTMWMPIEQADRRIQATARYLSTHAVRSMQDCWLQEASRRAKAALVEAMRSEGGLPVRNLSDERYEGLAALLLGVMKSAYFGITEGSTPLTPGEYLRITGQQGEL